MEVMAPNQTVRPKAPSVALRDALGRPLASLRLSVTGRCKIRCMYCMPEEHYRRLPQDHLLNFEELVRLVDIFTVLGVRRVRLTGGEPLLRRNLDRLVNLLSANPLIEDLALTTNGTLLAEQAGALRRAGLHRVTVSLDTLRPERFLAITRRDDHARVLDGIAAARREGFSGTKIDSVIMRGVNDDELSDLIEFGRAHDAEVRFIEYMDVPGATQWSLRNIVSRAEMLATLERRYGPITAFAGHSSPPASQFFYKDGTVFGIIASTTELFCARCDRSRLTADGIWYRCLYATAGTDMRRLLRRAAPQNEVATRIANLIGNVRRVRVDRGAEQRKAHHARSAFVPLDAILRDPHFEMHTRGG
jgi:cyclic pyranopterin phosphate synthase